VNRSLGYLLRSLVTRHHIQWDHILAQEEFTYNDSVKKRTGKSTFQIVCGMNPRGVPELRDLGHNEFRSVGAEDFTAEMQELHNQIKEQLKKRNNEYKHISDQHRRKLEF